MVTHLAITAEAGRVQSERIIAKAKSTAEARDKMAIDVWKSEGSPENELQAIRDRMKLYDIVGSKWLRIGCMEMLLGMKRCNNR